MSASDIIIVELHINCGNNSGISYIVIVKLHDIIVELHKKL